MKLYYIAIKPSYWQLFPTLQEASKWIGQRGGIIYIIAQREDADPPNCDKYGCLCTDSDAVTHCVRVKGGRISEVG